MQPALERAAAVPVLPPPRCWADGVPGVDRVTECQALGTDRLMLCPRHAEEILGAPRP